MLREIFLYINKEKHNRGPQGFKLKSIFFYFLWKDKKPHSVVLYAEILQYPFNHEKNIPTHQKFTTHQKSQQNHNKITTRQKITTKTQLIKSQNSSKITTKSQHTKIPNT